MGCYFADGELFCDRPSYIARRGSSPPFLCTPLCTVLVNAIRTGVPTHHPVIIMQRSRTFQEMLRVMSGVVG